MSQPNLKFKTISDPVQIARPFSAKELTEEMSQKIRKSGIQIKDFTLNPDAKAIPIEEKICCFDFLELIKNEKFKLIANPRMSFHYQDL